MFNISGFLEKFKKFDQDRSSQTGNIIRAIEVVVGIKVGKESFNVRNGVLFIHGSPALRQEIFLKKENLLPILKTEGIFDIR